MGYAASWIAVRGKSPQSVLDALCLATTDEYEEIPESRWCGTRWGDWYLVYANDFQLAMSSPLPALAEGAELVTCVLEEHVMVSSVSHWINGVEQWWVIHDAQTGSDHLQCTGRLPASYEETVRTRTAEQQAADRDHCHVDLLFKVPIEIAAALTGFRHDAEPPPGVRFERLMPGNGTWMDTVRKLLRLGS